MTRFSMVFIFLFSFITPLPTFSAYGAKDLELDLLCIKNDFNDDLFAAIREENKSSIDNYPIGLVFKGKKAHDARFVFDENSQLQIKNKHSYKYTVYVDKIVLRPKNGKERLFLDKETFALTGQNETMNFTCHKKDGNELENALQTVLDKFNS